MLPPTLKTNRLAWGGLTAVLGLVLVLAVAPVVVGGSGLIHSLFSTVCHQLPERSFQYNGWLFAVCQRCFGIYAGLFLGVLLFPWLSRWDAFFWKHSRPVLGGSLVLIAVDWALPVVHLAETTPWSRFITGSLFGLAAGYFLARGIQQALHTTPKHSPAELAMAQEAPR